MRDCRILQSGAHESMMFRGCRRRPRGLCALGVVWLTLTIAASAAAQGGGDAPLVEANTGDAAPMTNMGGGDFFSQELGSLVRLRYNTESYGQDEHGNFDIGTMQVTNFDDATAFFDGQVSLNEAQGIGFNLGVGYRWLGETPVAIEPERITGFSLWADGTDAHDGNFFPQVGVSFESLGDFWDMRVNGYIPVGERTQTGHFNPTGVVGFAGNSIVDQTVADQHTSFDVAELEIARRLGNERDAWAFAGPYVLANEDDNSAGWKVGLRGYAYPDLLLQFDVSQDDIFHTNATFSLVWFVGRTRSTYQPACGLPDRMREPVLRNDYVALSKTQVESGNPLTDTVSGQAFNIVHVASSAPAGGDGTFEHPLNNVADVAAHSVAGSLNNQVNGVTTPLPGSIILLHGGSVFDGATGGASGTLVLKDNQRLLGEGNNMTFTLSTTQHGAATVIPETFPGARAGAKPVILNSQGNPVVSLADTNEVANFTIDGGSGTGIGPGANGAGNPNIHDVMMQNVNGTGLAQGISLTSLLRDNDGNATTPQKTVAFNSTLNNLTFTNLSSDEITIDAALPSGVLLTDPNITNQEAMTISNITSTGGQGRGLRILDTHTGGTAAITNFNHDGGTTSGTALEFSNYAATANVSTSTLTGGAGDGVAIDTGSTGALTFASTLTFSDVHGRSVFISGNTGGTATFQDDITATPDAGNNAIELTNNTGQTINFLGNLNLSTPAGGGKAFTATGGGTLLVTGTTNSLTSVDGTALEITGMTLDTAGATFKNLNSGTNPTGLPLTGVGPVTAINLANNTGGPITVGDVTATAGQTGSIHNASGEAIIITDSANATINGITIDHPNTGIAGTVGVHVTKDSATTTSTVNLGNMEIDGGATGVQITGGGTTAGALTMTVNDTNITGPTTTGVLIGGPTANAGLDVGSVAFTNTKVNGNSVTNTAGVEVQNSTAAVTFDTASSILGMAGGSAFVVNGGTPNVTYNGAITNAAATPGDVDVSGITAGTVSFTPTSTITDTAGTGINVHANTGGSVMFQGTNSLSTGANPAVRLSNNTGESTTFADLTIATTSGTGFAAAGGGTVEVDGATNKITTTTGTGMSIISMIIGSGGVNFQSVSTNGATNGIVLNSDTGGAITVGSSGSTAGQGGTIQNSTDSAIKITDTANAVLNGVTVTTANTSTGTDAVSIVHDNATPMSVTMNTANITTAHSGVHINGTGGSGTFNVSSLGGNSTLTGNGNGLEVQGAVATVNDSDNITNSGTSHSINVHGLTAGTVTHTGTVNDTGTGIVVTGNTGGSTNLLGTYNVTTGATDAVTVTNNAGSTTQLTNLNIHTTSGGQGFVATGPSGTVTVTGTNNTIDTTTGVGLRLANMIVGGSGVNFAHVSVNGAASGIIVTNVTGGQVQVGNAGAGQNSGGNLQNTTGDAVILTDVQNVALRNLEITAAGARGVAITQDASAATAMDITMDDLHLLSSTGRGVDVLAASANAFTVRLTDGSDLARNVVTTDSGTGTFGLLVDSTTINNSANPEAAFDLEFSGSSHLGNVVFQNGDHFSAGNANALLVNSSGAAAKTINLLLDGSTGGNAANTFSNASATAFAADFVSNSGTTLNATIQGNTFTNSVDPAFDFDMRNATSASRVVLNLGGTGNEENTAAPGFPTGVFTLNNNAGGVFTVFDKTDTLANTRNNGTVMPLPNAASITDTATPPTPPTAP
jgi:hypothetical protein